MTITAEASEYRTPLGAVHRKQVFEELSLAELTRELYETQQQLKAALNAVERLDARVSQLEGRQP